jgi:hypothetical protein
MTYEVSFKLSIAGGSPARFSFRPPLGTNETRVFSVPVACQHQSRRVRHPHAAESLDLRLWRNNRDDAQAAPIGGDVRIQWRPGQSLNVIGSQVRLAGALGRNHCRRWFERGHGQVG